MQHPLQNAEYLLSEIAKGKTLHLSTMTRITAINQRTVERFARAGMPVLKNNKAGNLLLASGRKYVDASYCGVVLN